MGVGPDLIKFFNKSLALTLGDIRGRRMAELGDQKLWEAMQLTANGERVWFKDYAEARGCHHYSIDIHGQNGSHPLDLSKSIEDKFWHNNFDIVTNFGTAEHVEDQYECWRNIHNLGRPGCVYIHALPEYGRYRPYHCEYFFRSDFFTQMCKANKYTLLINESIETLGHIGACYIKPALGEFPSAKDANFMSCIKGPPNA